MSDDSRFWRFGFVCSYAMDVNVERAEDVLTHKRLLELAKDPAQRPAFAVRAVQVTRSFLLPTGFFPSCSCSSLGMRFGAPLM